MATRMTPSDFCPSNLLDAKAFFNRLRNIVDAGVLAERLCVFIFDHVIEAKPGGKLALNTQRRGDLSFGKDQYLQI